MVKPPPIGFCEKLVEARKAAGATQRKVSEQVEMGYTHYQSIERGRSKPRRLLLVKICDVLDLNYFDMRDLIVNEAVGKNRAKLTEAYYLTDALLNRLLSGRAIRGNTRKWKLDTP